MFYWKSFRFLFLFWKAEGEEVPDEVMAALEDQELDLDKDTTENPRDNMGDVMVIKQFCQTYFLSSNK